MLEEILRQPRARRPLRSSCWLTIGFLAGCPAFSPRAIPAQQREIDGRAPSPDTVGLPLAAARVVRFRTTEGTWMSLDVSPDGSTVVFELLGDLYTIPITGGTAKRLTSGMAFNRQPRYSPDGTHLVFISDRNGSANVWISDRDGSHLRQLSHLHGDPYCNVTSPAWSPDGRTIVVSQDICATRSGLVAASQEFRWLLAAYDVGTGRMRWISDTASDRLRPALGPTFGPDSHTIYAAVAGHGKNYFSAPGDWRIARVDRVTGRAQAEMWHGVGRNGMRPVISRNGRYLVYASSSGSHPGLRLRDLRTDRERWLVRDSLDDPPVLPGMDSRDLEPGYAFTPDARAVIVAYGGKIHRIDITTGRTAVIPFVADVERGLGPLIVHQFSLPDTAVRTRSVMQPALSPDGKWVAFSALDRIWIMELPNDGRGAGRPWRLTADSVGEFYPSWSPDGRWIAYSTWQDRKGGSVRRAYVTPDTPGRVGAPSERLTSDTALYLQTAVAPSGERVVAVRATLPPDRLMQNLLIAPQLVSVPAGGGMPHPVTSIEKEQHDRGWLGLASDELYFAAEPNRVYLGLTSWRLDGKGRQVVGAVTGVAAGSAPEQVTAVLSPDDRLALIARRNTLFELQLPQASPWGTIDLDEARSEPFGTASGAAHRWGTALAPWISWSRHGRRVLFGQGGTLFVGNVRRDDWTTFARVDVPLRIPVDVPRGIVVLHGARLITMRGNEVIEHGDIVVRDNRIVAIGPIGQVAIPSGAHVIDVTGTTILPGYVDLHDHMLLPRGIHPQACWQCLAMLAYGVTAARDPQPNLAADVFTYRERERAGDLISPRVFSTGIVYDRTDPPITTLADARDAVRPNADYFGSETFKVYHDPATMGRRARQLLAMAAAEKGLNATVEGGLIGALDLTVIIDGYSGLEHALPIRIYDDVATLIARSGTTHTQTYGAILGAGWDYMMRRHGGLWETSKMRRFTPPAARATSCDSWCTWAGPIELDNLRPIVSGAARIVAHGGRVGMGSHGDIPGIGFHYEMWLHALGGMPNHEILRSATIVGATAIGHGNDFGSLEPGKLADLQILDKNPLDDIHNTLSLRYVMKNGRLYEADDLTEVWPRHRPVAPTHLWEGVPGLDSTSTSASFSLP